MSITAGEKKIAGWAYAFLVYITAVLLYPVIFSQQASFCIEQDNLHQAYPFMNKLASSLHQGYLPLWDANTFSGNTFAGGFETGIFYPPSILFCLLFGTAKGIDLYYLDLLVAFHYLIAVLGMYQLARTFRISIAGAIIAALTYSFAGSLAIKSAGQTCIFFGLALLPWAIYFIASYYWKRRHWRYFAFAGLIAGAEILAGHMQPFFHTMLIGAVMIAFYEYKDRKSWANYFGRIIVNGAIIVLAASIMALPQLYYSAEYLTRCYRWVGGGILIAPGQKVPLYIYTHWFIIQLSDFANFLGKDILPPNDANLLYMGVLPLFLMAMFLFIFRRNKIEGVHRRLTEVLLIILATGIVSSLGYRALFCYLLYEIPFVNTVRQLGRYAILMAFSLSLLTGLGVSYLTEMKEYLFRNHTRTKMFILAALLLNAIYWFVFQSALVSRNVSIPFLLAFLFLLAFQKAPPVRYMPYLAVACICVDLLLNNVDYLPAMPPYKTPSIYARDRIIDTLEKSYGKYRVAFDMQDPGLEKRNLGDMYNIQTTYGYSATYFDKYLAFINVKGKNDPGTLGLLNVRYILSDKMLDTNFVFKDSLDHICLYESKSFYPRCYWKRQSGMPGSVIEEENKSTIHPVVYSDLYQKVDVDCVVPDTLIFSESNYPGWNCYDNGKKIPVFSAVIKGYPPLFRSIALDKGRHMIEFRYRKAFFWF